MDAFKRFLLKSIFGATDGSNLAGGRGTGNGGDDGIAAFPRYPLSEADWEAVRQLADERYRSWDWNYGRSPAFNVRQTKRIEGAGTYDVRLNVEGGVIREAAVYGDFFGTGEVSDFTAKLIGVRYDRDAIRAALADADLTVYFGPVNREEWLSLLIGD